MTQLINSETGESRSVLWATAGVAGLWIAGVMGLAFNGALALEPGVSPVMTLVAVLGPPLLFAVALYLFGDFRRQMLSLDPALLTALQGWRVLGGGFLFVYAFGHLPGFFAWPAGLGDVAVGIGAPFTAIALARGHLSIASNRLLAVHAAGLIDFVIAVGTGIAARNSIPGLVEGVTSAPMGELPLVLVPAIGVPTFIILHLIVLVQVWQARGAPRTLAAAAA